MGGYIVNTDDDNSEVVLPPLSINMVNADDGNSEVDLPPLCVECGEQLAGVHGFCFDCEGKTNDG